MELNLEAGSLALRDSGADEETVKVFNIILTTTGFVGWGELANPNNQ